MNMHLLDSLISPLRVVDDANSTQERRLPSSFREDPSFPSSNQDHPSQKAIDVTSQEPKSTSNFKDSDIFVSRNDRQKTLKNIHSKLYLPESSEHQVTKAIPISVDSMRRTTSEVDLIENEAIADYRDYCMYTRIVNGMSEHQSWQELPGQKMETIRHIIRTRHEPAERHDGPSSYVRESMLRHTITTPQNQKDTRQAQLPLESSSDRLSAFQLPLHQSSSPDIATIEDPASSFYHYGNMTTGAPSNDLDLSARLSTMAIMEGSNPGHYFTGTREGIPPPNYVSFHPQPLVVEEDEDYDDAAFEMDDF